MREILTLVSLVSVTLVIIYVSAAWITDTVVQRITPQQEAVLFESFMDASMAAEVPDEMESRFKRADDILTRLLEYSEVVPLEYQLQYSAEQRPNAYAVPGGTIIITHGLLENLDEEIALAFVIGHELGHFAGRDHLRGMGRSLGFRVALALLTGGNPDGLLTSASQFMLLGHSRSVESAADRFSIECLDTVYGENAGAERLFELLEASDQIPEWAHMFMTHPSNAERIREIHQSRSEDE